MSTEAEPTYIRFGELMANIEKIRKAIAAIEESDPLMGKNWKVGMLRSWGEKLDEAIGRASEYAKSLGLDPEQAVASGS